MPISDALVVGEDWISEHYFTADATKETFQGKVLERRKAWEAEEAATTRSRFLAARGELERRLVGLAEGTGDDEGGARPPLTDEQRTAVAELDDLLLEVLGYRTGEYALRDEGPITWVAPPSIPQNPPLAIVRARPQATLDDLVAKHAPTLLTPWEREGHDSISSVSATLSTLMTNADGPTFALVLAGRWCLIAEKERWPEGRWLAVDLQLVCERNDAKRGGEIDRALACLDAVSLAPDASGTTWWRETLDDSVKHTVGVSKDLREGVRLSIEILANEVLQRRAAQGLEPLPADQAQPLAIQCLRYLYRILFLLYAEASPELGVLPVGAQEYDAGYGLDRLRDLALTEIHSDRARTGTHLYESLDRLFVLVDRGHTPAGDDQLPDGLEFQGLRADLFRPEATAHLDATKLGNEALLQVLRKLLLSKESAKQQRGFISYVELGINQLGAVYEGLMSYTGSFATEDLYEVAKGGNPEKGSWVVPVHRSDHLDRADFVMVRNEETGEDEPVIHRKGTFVFRLSGRDRQRSASYYTPEVLTRFTVQQALEELLDQDGHRTTAAEILELTVCEPALGSGAFAIEAVRQLAEQYISRREEELGEKVDPEARPHEVQKVKAHIALHQVYGVDLNATAVELAEVSLWLDTMVAGLSAPWFGLRLRRGNSLVGARHALYGHEQLPKKAWLTTPPTDVKLSDLAVAVDSGSALRPDGGIHHFLLPARGWGSAVEVPKSVKDLMPAETLKRLKTWRAEVRKAPSKAQVKQLQALSVRVEALWGLALRRLRIAEAESSRAIDVWGRDVPAAPSTVAREQIEESLNYPNGAYQRLRAVMDAWCALWFWPLSPTSAEPPTYEQWLDACRMILGTTPNARWAAAGRTGEDSIFTALTWAELNDAESNDLNFAQVFSMRFVRQKHPWLDVCAQIADTQGFFHWELEFATVFARGGFDLQVGNPPWVRPDVALDPLLAETDPWWLLAIDASHDLRRNRLRETLSIAETWREVTDSATESSVVGSVLNDAVCYPTLAGRPDLYRAFMSQAWRHSRSAGRSALIHYDTHFTDEKAATFRARTYRQLRRHWHFINERKLFDIQHQTSFGVNVYGPPGAPHFLHAAALYVPETVIRSLSHDGSGREPGFKDDDGRWDLRPHNARIQLVDTETLKAWAATTGAPDWSSVPMIYAVNGAAARTIQRIAQAGRIAQCTLEYSSGFNQTTASQAGDIRESWGEVPWAEAVIQGSHLSNSWPLFKSPPKVVRTHADWIVNDIEALAARRTPVVTYRAPTAPACEIVSIENTVTSHGYRMAWRTMANNGNARTLISAIVPRETRHVDAVYSAQLPSFSDRTSLPLLQASLGSLLADFAVRIVPKRHIRAGVIDRLPFLARGHPLASRVCLRVLQLNCVTEAYADLWKECWEEGFEDDGAILQRFDDRPIGPVWTPDTPLRRAADRRNAQVEIDAMVAIMLRVPIEDLCTIYRTQFAVLYGHDHREYTYDTNGRLVPYEVLNRWRKQGEPQAPSQMPEEDRTATHPSSGIAYTYVPPFATYDRESDFREVSSQVMSTASSQNLEEG